MQASVTPSAQYRLTIRVKIDEGKNMLGQVTDMIGEQGGMVIAVSSSPWPTAVM